MKVLKGRMFEIAAGLTKLPEQVVDKYREKWKAAGYTLPPKKPTGAAPAGSSRYGVGSRMADKIEWMTGLPPTSTKKCNCANLQSQMNQEGPHWCETYFDWIVSRIVNNARQEEVLPLFGVPMPGFILRTAAGRAAAGKVIGKLLRDAIEEEKSLSSRDPKSIARSHRRRETRIRRTRRDLAHPFRMTTGKFHFVRSSQLQMDILELVSRLPPDITAIAGVARSGLCVATMVSMYLHLPMLTIRQTMNDVVATGNGWRLGGSQHIDPDKQKICIIDDTVMTGNSLKAIAPMVRKKFGNAITATVYCNPNAKQKPDIWAVDLEWPHILEWNVFNSILSPVTAMDFDGILCKDCPRGSDDDGPKYREFIRNAPPLYQPRRCPVPLVVTARIEKYREETMAWLRRHRIQVRELVMHPAPTLRDRMRDDIAAFKARHYQRWARSVKPRPGPALFMESDPRQAAAIHKLTKLVTVCPHTAEVHH